MLSEAVVKLHRQSTPNGFFVTAFMQAPILGPPDSPSLLAPTLQHLNIRPSYPTFFFHFCFITFSSSFCLLIMHPTSSRWHNRTPGGSIRWPPQLSHLADHAHAEGRSTRFPRRRRASAQLVVTEAQWGLATLEGSHLSPVSHQAEVDRLLPGCLVSPPKRPGLASR